jgi:putative N6-adenine-specific DNA methylase
VALREGALAFFATAAKGTEPALKAELREHRFPHVRADRGGVHFGGPLVEGYRACLLLRCAGRVLVEIGRFDAAGSDALYEGVRAIDWSDALDPSRTLAVRASCRSSGLTHSQFIAQRTKDAIVDQLRGRYGARPSVDLEDPDVLVFLHLVRDVATVYLDLGGASLHKRGYRAAGAEAPLKEHLAASILRLSGWDRSAPLLDPMCGSGTLAIEAALWSRNVAPGLTRERFGFERWASYGDESARALAELRTEVAARALTSGPKILASDVDERTLAIARRSARNAGVSISFSLRSIADIEPLERGAHVVMNPPYGERIAFGPAQYAELGAAIRKLRGHVVTVLAGTPTIARAIPLRPTRAHALWNGDIECRLLTYEVA